jgi:hypothetical protein
VGGATHSHLKVAEYFLPDQRLYCVYFLVC